MIRIPLKIHRSYRQSPGAQRARLVRVIGARESSETRTKRANKVFKIIVNVSCLMFDGQDKP